jgi:hypothetical protein
MSEEILTTHPDHFINFEEVAHFQACNLSSMEEENPDEIKDYFGYELPSTQTNDIMSQLDSSNSYDPISSDGSHQNSNDLPPFEKKKSNRPHAKGKRKGREEKSALQLTYQKGYWTKNFLPTGKNPHLNFIGKKMGVGFIMTNRIVSEIKKKSGVTMDDYLALYQMEELRGIWPEFFRKRVLYRELMLTRAEKMSKIIFEKFLHRYAEAFETGVFDHIA